MADLDITGRVIVDASQAEGAFERVGDKAEKMAREVAGAANQAGKAVDGMGDGASASAEKFTREEARIRDAIKRSTQELKLFNKTASEKFEVKLSDKGFDTGKFKEYINELKRAEAAQLSLAQTSAGANSVATASLNNMGMSAKATAAALRGVPAQFTDIAVSLQGGQKPLTVLLQQGGQLKDMFGGIGNAARALGGYVIGLVNPFTLVAGAVIGLGVAMASANNKESEFAGLAVRLTATGRGALSATDDLKKMINELNQLPGVSRAAAGAIVDEFSRVKGVSVELFRGLGASVADFAAATGTDIPTAAKKLAAAFDDPAKGAKELESALGTLSAEQLLTIEKMAALGDKAGAQAALLDALQVATKGLANDGMTPLGKATDSLSNAWDGLMRSVSASDALKAANATLSSLIKGVTFLINNADKFPKITAGLAFGPLGVMAAQIGQGAGDAYRMLKPNEGVTGSWAEAPKPSSALDGQVKDVLEATAKYKSTGSEIERVKAIAGQAKEALAGLEKQNRGTSIAAQALRDRIGGLNEELTKLGKRGKEAGAATAGQSEVASIRAKVSETQRLIDAMKAQGLEGAKQSEGERLAAKIREELTTGIKGAARANKELALVQAEKLIGLDKEKSAIESLLKAQKDFQAARDKETSSRNAEILKIEEKAQALEDEIAMYGKGKAAIEAMTIARLEEKKAVIGGFDGSEERIAQIDAEIAARKRLAASADQLAGLKANTQADELLRNAKEQSKLYEDEYKLTGLTALERAKVVAQRKVELDYAKKLADLDKLPDGPEKESAKLKINEAALIESSAAVNRVVQDDWAKTTDQINQSLTDALLRGFESGKDFAKNLRDTVINMFKTMVLRPIISAVMAPVSGVVNAGLNAVGLGGGGAGGLLNTASTANSLYGAATGYSSGVNAAAGFLGAGTTAGASAVSLGYANAVGAVGGDALGALIAGNASWGGVAAGGAATAGAGAAGAGAATAGLAAVPVVGWIALAALAAYAVFSGKEDERFGSQGSYTPGKGTESNGGPNGALDDFGAVSAGNKATATTIDKILERVGSKDRLSYFAGGFESSKNDNGFSYAGGILSNGKVFGQGTDGLGYMNLRGSMSPEEAQARYANELKQATLEALQSATDIPKAISSKLDGVNIEALSGDALNQLVAAVDKQIAEVDTFRGAMLSMPFEKLKGLSFDAAAGLIAASGGLEQLTANLGSYYENFFSAEEKRAVTVSNIASIINAAGGDISASTIASATRAQARAYVESVDVSTEAGQKLKAALLSVAGAFAGITEVAANTSAALLDAIKAARGDLDTALSAQSQQRISTYRSEASALQATVDKHRAYADELKKFRDSLLLSDLSPLTPEQRYAEAQQQFEAAKASGDAGQLQSASSALLEASKVYNASNATYISDFAKVQAALTQASINSSATADVAQLQLTAVQAQLDVLNVVNTSVLSVANAIERLSAAVLAAVNAGQNPGLDNIAALTGGVQNQMVGNAYLSSGGAGAINGANGLQIYTPGGQHYTGDEVLKRAKELAAAGDYRGMYDQAKAAGIGLASVNQLMGWQTGTAEEWAKANGLPIFHLGTNFVEQTGPALLQRGEAVVPRIYNPAAGGQGMGSQEVLTELRGLRADNALLREEVKQLRSQSSAQTGALIESNFAAHEKTAQTITTSTSKAGWSKKPELV